MKVNILSLNILIYNYEYNQYIEHCQAQFMQFCIKKIKSNVHIQV